MFILCSGGCFASFVLIFFWFVTFIRASSFSIAPASSGFSFSPQWGIGVLWVLLVSPNGVEPSRAVPYGPGINPDRVRPMVGTVCYRQLAHYFTWTGLGVLRRGQLNVPCLIGHVVGPLYGPRKGKGLS